MARMGLDKNVIIYQAAQLANEIGIENITLKMLADELNVQPPSLYNHIKGLEDVRKELMIYGWKQIEEKLIEAAIGITGYDAIEALCHAFYEYAIKNPGVFNAMLWYNNFENKDMQKITAKLFAVVYKISSSLNISEENCNHLVRGFRGFLEGFSLLVNNNAFGAPFSVDDTFNICLKTFIAGLKTIEGK